MVAPTAERLGISFDPSVVGRPQEAPLLPLDQQEFSGFINHMETLTKTIPDPDDAPVPHYVIMVRNSIVKSNKEGRNPATTWLSDLLPQKGHHEIDFVEDRIAALSTEYIPFKDLHDPSLVNVRRHGTETSLVEHSVVIKSIFRRYQQEKTQKEVDVL